MSTAESSSSTLPVIAVAAPPPYRLHGVWPMTVAAILGTPLPAFWMAAQNFRHLDRPRDARKALALGIALMVTNLVLAFLVPESTPNSAIALPFLIATKLTLNAWLDGPIAQHRAAGGQLHGWGLAIGYGLIALILVLIVVFGAVFLIEWATDSELAE